MLCCVVGFSLPPLLLRLPGLDVALVRVLVVVVVVVVLP